MMREFAYLDLLTLVEAPKLTSEKLAWTASCTILWLTRHSKCVQDSRIGEIGISNDKTDPGTVKSPSNTDGRPFSQIILPVLERCPLTKISFKRRTTTSHRPCHCKSYSLCSSFVASCISGLSKMVRNSTSSTQDCFLISIKYGSALLKDLPSTKRRKLSYVYIAV